MSCGVRTNINTYIGKNVKARKEQVVHVGIVGFGSFEVTIDDGYGKYIVRSPGKEKKRRSFHSARVLSVRFQSLLPSDMTYTYPKHVLDIAAVEAISHESSSCEKHRLIKTHRFFARLEYVCLIPDRCYDQMLKF